jgi:Alanine dehydrogenase/PNT, N-terminal domain
MEWAMLRSRDLYGRSLRLKLQGRDSNKVTSLSSYVRTYTSTNAVTKQDVDKSKPAPKGIPYSNLRIGIPKETFPLEKRVAATPTSVAAFLKPGFKAVNIETGAGVASYFSDDVYKAAGATIVDDVYSQSDIILKVCIYSATIKTIYTNDMPFLDENTLINISFDLKVKLMARINWIQFLSSYVHRH